MISDFVHDLCRGTQSVTSVLATNPTKTPGDACDELYSKSKMPKANTSEQRNYDLERAYECGKWGNTRPSELFLKMYDDVLCTLDKNHPLAGVCSPSLLGTSGVCPLIVISTIPDICRHMSNLIAKAEKEVFLATNFWKYSEPTRLITNAFHELSRRAVADNRRVVVKVLYDRGSPSQIIKHHQSVPPKSYADPEGAVRIPKPEDIPNVDLEVMNFHTPPVGTFHAKFMIVDRKIAILQSNNIQDNDNLEMMAQYEGAIVDSIYDMALISWQDQMKPPMPLLGKPSADIHPPPSFTGEAHQPVYGNDGSAQSHTQDSSAVPADTDHVQDIAAKAEQTPMPRHTSQDPHYDDDVKQEIVRAVSGFVPRDGQPLIQGVTNLLNVPDQDTKPSAPDITPEQMMTPMIPLPFHEPFPIAMVNREPYGMPTHSSVHVPQNAAFTSGLRNATKSVFIQTPNLNAEALLPEIIAAVKRGINVTYFYCLGYNDAGELLPRQNGHNESVAHRLYSELSASEKQNLNIHAYVAKDQKHPIHNKFKKRSCHIKVMVVDDHIAIQGSGNQDTQSWYHSQEVNIMLDSAMVCEKWMQGIRQNENTHLYGQVLKDGDDAGCWVDPDTGKQADGAIGVDAGKFAWATGIKGAIERVRGVGGF